MQWVFLIRRPVQSKKQMLLKMTVLHGQNREEGIWQHHCFMMFLCESRQQIPCHYWRRSWAKKNTFQPSGREFKMITQQGKNMPHWHPQYMENFTCDCTGLWLNPPYPHLGVSPDGVTSCSCYEDGLLEIKCPFSAWRTAVLSKESCSFLTKSSYFKQEASLLHASSGPANG